VSGSSRTRQVAPWAFVALLGAFTGLLFAFAVAGTDGAATGSLVAESGQLGSVAPAAEQSTAGQGPSARALTAVAPEPKTRTGSPDGTSLAGPPSEGATSSVGNGLRLMIPALAVDAPVIDLGFTDDGVLDVPHDGGTVGWYEISSRPGEPGNALIGGHFDWDGSLAVFWRLRDLEVGDRIELAAREGSQLVYEVRSTAAVDWDQPMSDILSLGEGVSRLTLFTCGGEFDRARGEYQQRLVVWATLVEPAPLASRP